MLYLDPGRGRRSNKRKSRGITWDHRNTLLTIIRLLVLSSSHQNSQYLQIPTVYLPTVAPACDLFLSLIVHRSSTLRLIALS